MMDRIMNHPMNSMTTAQLFSYAQPEDEKKFGKVAVNPEFSDEFDTVAELYASDFEAVEQEMQQEKAHFVQRRARAERRRVTRNKKTSRRRNIARYKGLPEEMIKRVRCHADVLKAEAFSYVSYPNDNAVKQELRSTFAKNAARELKNVTPRFGHGQHEERYWWKDERERAENAESRKEMLKIRQTYLGYVEHEAELEKYNKEERVTLLEAAKILGVPVSYLYRLPEYVAEYSDEVKSA